MAVNPAAAPFKAMGRDVERTANLFMNLARSLALTAALAGIEMVSPGLSETVFTPAQRAEGWTNIVAGVGGAWASVSRQLPRQAAREAAAVVAVEGAEGPVAAALETQAPRAVAEAGGANSTSLASTAAHPLEGLSPSNVVRVADELGV